MFFLAVSFVFVAMVCDYALIGLNLLPSSLRGLSARAGFVGGGRKGLHFGPRRRIPLRGSAPRPAPASGPRRQG